MKATMMSVITLALAFAAAPSEADVPKHITLPGVDETYSLVWHDEFDGTDYDRSKWECPISFRQGASLWHPDNLTITGGVARFGIHYNPDWNIRYQSAALRTQKRYDGIDLFTFTYGYVEARCRLPRATNCNYWAAFWLLSTHNDGKSTDTRTFLTALKLTSSRLSFADTRTTGTSRRFTGAGTARTTTNAASHTGRADQTRTPTTTGMYSASCGQKRNMSCILTAWRSFGPI